MGEAAGVIALGRRIRRLVAGGRVVTVDDVAVAVRALAVVARRRLDARARRPRVVIVRGEDVVEGEVQVRPDLEPEQPDQARGDRDRPAASRSFVSPRRHLGDATTDGASTGLTPRGRAARARRWQRAAAMNAAAERRRPGSRILLVDDDASILATFTRILRGAGHVVHGVDDVTPAVAAIAGGGWDVVITDMHLPEGTGLEVLEAVLGAAPGTPVLFMTGATELGLAVRALEHGALRYLTKPVMPAELLRAIESARRVSGLAGDVHGPAGRELANLDVRLDGALASLSLACQPIVRWSERRVTAFEVLVRNREASLRRPDRLIEAATRLGRLAEVGRAVRARAAALAAELAPGVDLHVNVHPLDLLDPDLVDPAAPLAQVASRVVLELTERLELDDVEDATETIARLRALGYRIAVDDLGNGYAGLTSLAQVRPHVVKLDGSLCHGVALDPTRQALVEAMRTACARTGAEMVCEGVEHVADLAALVELGCDVFQGHLFARPAPAIAEPSWPSL